MLIDWFTTGAQMVNFIVLVGLMKRFLYKPILLAIDAREQRVARELADAAERTAEASKERDALRAKNELFDQQRSLLMTQVKDEANLERARLVEAARQTADAMSAKLLATYRADVKMLNTAIVQRTQQEAYSVARKALLDLASSSLEEQLCTVFVERLRHMEGSAKTRFATTLRTATTPALVCSAFELPESQRAIFRQVVRSAFATDIELRFETQSNLICGIEFSANGEKIVWTLADYLSSLEKAVAELIEQQTQTRNFQPSQNALPATHESGA